MTGRDSRRTLGMAEIAGIVPALLLMVGLAAGRHAQAQPTARGPAGPALRLEQPGGVRANRSTDPIGITR